MPEKDGDLRGRFEVPYSPQEGNSLWLKKKEVR